ncbi:MAG TPA: HAD family hydrolase [Pseudomonadales bacterium]|nr:HAD family hydrolase [Pseudomonadales bacterium]
MLKALFFDMDETLCDTDYANRMAKQLFAGALRDLLGGNFDADHVANEYVRSIYREWQADEQSRYMPIIQTSGERAFRVQLIADLAQRYSGADLSEASATWLLEKFDSDRLQHFDFYPGIKEFLIDARQYFTTVVITNGPEHSQLPKLATVQMEDYVDFIIVGGQEPAQKPAVSIFEKALGLAGCEAHEAIHVGDSLAADIQGAHNSKITSVWIQHQQPLDAELGINPQHTLLHPSEIPALIRQLSGDVFTRV